MVGRFVFSKTHTLHARGRYKRCARRCVTFIVVLHASLVELAEQAPRCHSAAAVRGVLAESQDLIRNALDHDENPQDMVSWFSRLVTDTLHSAGARELTGGATLVLTGPVGRGDALPSSPIQWLVECPCGLAPDDIDTEPLAQLITQVGLVSQPTVLGVHARYRQDWLALIRQHAGRHNYGELAVFADAGTWCLAEVLRVADPIFFLREALCHRPPSLKLFDGLPDKHVVVNVRRDLLYPIIALARWAGVAAKSQEFSTLARVRDAQQAGVMTANQADYLRQAWHAGLQLQLQRFVDRVHSHETTAESLPAIQRSVFGASARMVSDVAHALARDYGLEVR